MILMRGSYPKIFIIILNYNNWQDTIECVESVLKNDYPNYQVIVLDNNSPDNSMKHIKDWADKTINYVFFNKNEIETMSISNSETVLGLKESKEPTNFPLVLIQNGENKGYAAGNNVFLRFLLKNDIECFVFLLNPDTTIEPYTLKNLIKCAKKDRMAVYGVNIYDYFEPKKEIIKGGFKITHYGTVKPIRSRNMIGELDFISGSALFCHIDVFKKIGLLPEEYFLYWEDADWCTLAKKQGIKLQLCKDTKVFDKGGKSTGGRGNSLSDYYYTLNIFKYYEKYLPFRKKSIYFFVVIRGLKKFLKGNFSNGIAIFKAMSKVLFNRGE